MKRMTYKTLLAQTRLTGEFQTYQELHAHPRSLEALVRRGLAERRQLGCPGVELLPEYRKAGVTDEDVPGHGRRGK